ncbi:MAG: hypothetical protein ACFFBD_03170 [Candidatus Hodarchaeota archaeon]
MSYSDYMNQLIASGYISTVAILDPSGNIYWTNNQNWQFNGADVLNQWKGRATAVHVGGTKFSAILNNPPEFFVGKNIPQQAGVLVIARAPNGYYFLTWTPASAPYDTMNIYTEVTRMSALFK